MDTSKRYIEMCKGAFKYIGYIKPDNGLPNLMIPHPKSIEHQRGTDLILTYVQILKDVWIYSTAHKPIGQVYRQDQLQEMWMKHPEKHPDDAKLESKMDAFIYWLWGETFRCDFYPPQYNNFSSMEQLWLAFVMEEKYNKTWNGKEWKEE